MPLPRIQAFELNDLASAPTALREGVVETLSRALRWGRMTSGLVARFEDFLAASGATEVLDLCAGAAGPAAILAAEIARRGARPPRFWLTDLFPRREAWEEARRAHPDSIDFVPDPVDATAIAPELAAGRARVIINAFHHFPPELARAIVADAARSSRGLFIAEAFERNPLAFANFAPAGLAALLANPLLAHRQRLAKALLTWATPIMLAAGVWDGLVSTLRVYTESELHDMAAEAAPGWRFTYGTYRFPPFGKGYYFYGVPADPRA
ncbi:MAG: hypothetical protein IT373_14830 [Polyangiaceae bacterium]|nr:hypothetical protein [Polyangiaceae bacterium]